MYDGALTSRSLCRGQNRHRTVPSMLSSLAGPSCRLSVLWARLSPSKKNSSSARFHVLLRPARLRLADRPSSPRPEGGHSPKVTPSDWRTHSLGRPIRRFRCRRPPSGPSRTTTKSPLAIRKSGRPVRLTSRRSPGEKVGVMLWPRTTYSSTLHIGRVSRKFFVKSLGRAPTLEGNP